MADGKASLFRETWAAIKTSKGTWGKWVVGLGVAYGAVIFVLVHFTANPVITEQLKQNPQLFKQHPELLRTYIHQELTYLAIFLPVLLIYQFGSIYSLTVFYLRSVMSKTPPVYNLPNFFYYLKKALWRIIRPLPWLLIPIIGVFFYIRSQIRYMLVTPLAVLRRGKELKTSWNMAKDNWWRLFLNALGLGLTIGILALLVCIIPLIIVAIVSDVTKQPEIMKAGTCLMQGLLTTLLIMTNTIYACTAYRILRQEQKITNTAGPNPVTI